MSIQENLDRIESKIEEACKRAGRPRGSVSLVAVTKRQNATDVDIYCRLQHARNKEVLLGENFVQEFRDKRQMITTPYSSHLIGALQRNKAKMAVELFDVIESLGSLKLLEEIDKHAGSLKKVQGAFLQVNISDDQAKSGFLPKDLDEDFFENLKHFKNLNILGLMTITKLYDEPEDARLDFRNLKILGDKYKNSFYNKICYLSMGMSDDFEVAIEEGATHVRIGTALFGQRS